MLKQISKLPNVWGVPINGYPGTGIIYGIALNAKEDIISSGTQERRLTMGEFLDYHSQVCGRTPSLNIVSDQVISMFNGVAIRRVTEYNKFFNENRDLYAVKDSLFKSPIAAMDKAKSI